MYLIQFQYSRLKTLDPILFSLHCFVIRTKHNQCILCFSDDLKTLDDYDRVPLFKCKSCNFVFAQDIPTTNDLEEYYRNYGTSHYLSPVTVTRYYQWLDQFEAYKKSGKILDVGCGSGFFLSEAKKRGWEVYGTEFSDALVNICKERGITMSQGALNNETYYGIEFDVILSIEVLEHINNPVQEIGHIKRLLRSGGLFFCTTPNFNGISRYWLRDRYNIIAWPEHLGYFTPSTIKTLMMSQGFKTKKVTTTGFSITRFKGSLNISNQKVVSSVSDDEKLRLKAESNFILKSAKSVINFILNITGSGTSLKGWFMKT